MDRGVSSGGGQSSLDYLFGGDEAPKSAEKLKSVQKPTPSSSTEKLKEIPAGIQSSKANNYYRSEGQNCGNFLTAGCKLCEQISTPSPTGKNVRSTRSCRTTIGFIQSAISTEQELLEYITLLQRISHVTVDPNRPDDVVCKWTGHSYYTSSSAYESQFKGSCYNFNSSLIWNAKAENKCIFFCLFTHSIEDPNGGQSCCKGLATKQ